MRKTRERRTRQMDEMLEMNASTAGELISADNTDGGAGIGGELLDRICRIEQMTDSIVGMGERLDELSRQVRQSDRVASLIGELRELPRLFSGADAQSIDEEGWQSIMDGGSVIGAYVRSEHRRRLAEEANKAGAAASAGEAKGGIGAVYSVDEIRQMDRSTVRKNLDKVLSSLEAVKG